MSEKGARKKQPVLKMKALQSVEVVYPEDPTEFLEYNPQLKDLTVVFPNGERKRVFEGLSKLNQPWAPQLAYYVCAIGIFGGITATYLNFSERKTAAAIQAKLLAPELSIHEYEDYASGKVISTSGYRPGVLPPTPEIHFGSQTYSYEWLTNLIMYQRHLPWQNLMGFLDVQEMAGMLKKQVEMYLNKVDPDKRLDFQDIAKSIMQLGEFFLDMSERSLSIHMDLIYKGYRLDEIEKALGVRQELPQSALDVATLKEDKVSPQPSMQPQDDGGDDEFDENL